MNISASVYAADPLNIERDIQTVISTIDSLHFDVMDGHFTQAYGLNISLFSRLKTFTSKPIDVHLMVNNPEVWAEKFAALGARWVAFHPESCHHPEALIQAIQNSGSKAYLAFGLNNQPHDYKHLFSSIDGVLILSAPAGGGEFDVTALDKIAQIPANLPIAFDGKITPARLPDLRKNNGDLAIMGAAMWP
ncbi:hypothetical protein [uncultured Cedecea sp.]|uniref:ribulose-phosphate 3-epimerase n=1 Tax=uncultured Cedecea sp. TaxID=988762 RepID=UPI002633347D|nr:hypothetical protein [uncultured Cedecea sp.]